MRVWSTVALLAAGCDGCHGEIVGLGSGPEKDARFIADVYTWDCQDSTTGELYEGVYAQTMSLEFAPDALLPVSLPSEGGCSSSSDMFPEDAGDGGSDLDGMSGEPIWETDAATGQLAEVSTGFWYDDVLGNQRSCQYVDDLLSGGTRLADAGELTGVTTPEPALVPDVEFDSGEDDAISWGEAVTASWGEADGWESAWVQFRRERDGLALETVTCNVTGDTSWTPDEIVWELMTEELPNVTNSLYVGLEKKDQRETDDGLKVEVLTRAVAVAVVLE